MVLTELLLKIPYSIAWRLANASNNAFPVVFYCTDYLDYLVFKPIREYLPEITIVSKNRKVKDLLFEKGISSIQYPVYPKAVIMARHANHMFPSSKILKIGMRHGPYHFKNFIKSEKYNKFDLFLFTSEEELNIAKKLGIDNGEAVGFPKIDELVDNSISEKKIQEKKIELGFDNRKKTILFSATWSKSGLSAIDKWYNNLTQLNNDYNVLVTVHPFTERNIIDEIKSVQNIYFIENEDLNIYLKIADLLVADTSSIIGEFNALLKPIVTFRVEEQGRLNPIIVEQLNKISYRVDSYKELLKVIPKALSHKELFIDEQKRFNKIIFSDLKGKSAKKAAFLIESIIKKAGISFD